MSAPDALARPASAPYYTLDNHRAEQHRLRLQSTSLRAHDLALLDRIELEPGAVAVDLGCGPGGSTRLLARRVGTGGHVVGVDIDATSVAAARAFVQEQRLANVEIVQADARHTGLTGAAFHLVHTRLLLVNIPAPQQVVTEMARLVRPGGWVAVLEPDVGLRVCHPPHPALRRLTELLVTAYQSEGADPLVGRRVPHLLATAGLVDVRTDARADVCPPGHPQRTVILDLVQNMRTRILERELIDGRELSRLDRAARRHLDRPEVLSIPVTYFLTRARKPAWTPSVPR